MKSRSVSMMVLMGMIFLLAREGFCQNAVSVSEWVEKVGPGSINWSAGYVEAIGIAAMPDKSMSKINARPAALREATVAAQRNLLEITKGVRIDSRSTIRDFTLENDMVNTQVEGLIKGAQVVDQQYMSDGTVEVKLRMPLYGNLSQIMMPLSIEKRKSDVTPAPVAPVPAPSAPTAPAAPAATAPPVPAAYTGLVVDARSIGARPAMSPRIYDENGKEVYVPANVDRECAISQGMSRYARDLTSAQTNQRVAANALTVKALRIGSTGKSDLMISNADATQIRASAENSSFMKQCRVMIVLD